MLPRTEKEKEETNPGHVYGSLGESIMTIGRKTVGMM
jgi:hypothetical protein